MIFLWVSIQMPVSSKHVSTQHDAGGSPVVAAVAAATTAAAEVATTAADRRHGMAEYESGDGSHEPVAQRSAERMMLHAQRLR